MAEVGLAVNATGTATDNEAAEDAAAGNVAKNAAATDPEPTAATKGNASGNSADANTPAAKAAATDSESTAAATDPEPN